MSSLDFRVFYGSLDLCAAPFALEFGADFGAPEAVTDVIAALLMDGEIEATDRLSNRQFSFVVHTEGDTLDDLANAEALLMEEANRVRNTLTIYPGDGAEPSVFDTFRCVPKPLRDDNEEINRLRRWSLQPRALPTARRSTLTTVVADPIPDVAPTVTTIDACTSATGWSSSNATSTVSVVSGAVRSAWNGPGGSLDLKRDGLSVDLGADLWLVLTAQNASTVLINGTAPIIGANGGDGARYLRPVAGTVVNSIIVSRPPFGMGGFDVGDWIAVSDISTSDQLPTAGSGLQRQFSMTIGGTARTQADLKVEVGSGALGEELMLFTAPEGAAISPPLRTSYLTSGAAADPDTACLSGNKTALSQPIEFEVPVSVLPPGTHLLLARISHEHAMSPTLAANIDWSASVGSGTAAVADANESGSTAISIDFGDFHFYQLATMTLPLVRMDPESDAVVKIAIDTAHANAATIQVDDVYLCNLDTGVLTLVERLRDSDQDPSKFAFRSATLSSSGRPEWIVGTAGTHVDDVDVSSRLVSAGVHEFNPGVAAVFTATPSDVSPAVTATFYERFNTYVPPPVI